VSSRAGSPPGVLFGLLVALRLPVMRLPQLRWAA
jgi:hypothetical protein